MSKKKETTRQGLAFSTVKNGFAANRLQTKAGQGPPLPPMQQEKDPILYWNKVALEANKVSHTAADGERRGPVLSARAMAIVHLAMYDAYAGVMNNPAGLAAYQQNLKDPHPGASAEVAVAAAAYLTLSTLYTKQRAFFQAEWDRANLGGPGFDAGRNYGMYVAQQLLDARKDDPDASDLGYAPSIERGAHRPDPVNPGQGYHAPFYGERCKPFAIQNVHVLDTPPQPGDPEYIDAVREVREKGIAPELTGALPAGSTPRTPDETVVGVYWAYDGASGLGTPPRLYNQIVREVAINQGNDTARNARLFALVNVAMADAGIRAWQQKYEHNLWRPVLGVRENDPSMGLDTNPGAGTDGVGDPEWLPYGAPKSNEIGPNTTPPFPAYPSGHATFGAAALHITRLFCGVTDYGRDDLFDGLTFVSDELNGKTTDNKGVVRTRHEREFVDGLWQMIEENGSSRLYLGVHWLFDAYTRTAAGEIDTSRNVGGVPLGLAIAEDIFNSGMTPAP